MKSQEKAEKIIHIFDNSFKPRWVRYIEVLKSNLNKSSIWIDCGCGENEYVKEFGTLAGKAIGLDVFEPHDKVTPFIAAPVNKLPFENNTIDFATLRFVAEHLPNPDSDLNEIERVLKPGGRLIVLTTNVHNPVIALARLLPYRFKKKLITKIFKVEDEDIFPTYHNFNTPKAFNKKYGKLSPIHIEYISDINRTNNFFFVLYLLWHLFTTPKFINRFRSNILAVYGKTN
ncbi:MAG: hypothetical protein A2X64_04705 [Ignavibacteria bacterium GWF2_33_9]|nr:MAG: hypothetical protein A2X64_04705 [Ignavibacteria bacterium GWF2_33_9]